MKFEETELKHIAEQVAVMLKEQLVGMLSNMKKTDEETLLSVDELAEYLKVDKGYVYKKVSWGEIPHIKMGRYTRFWKRDIDNWLDAQAVPA